MKYTNADICELVAKLEGFIHRLTPSFNINEWYGFNNSSQQIAYFKVCQGADKNGTGKYNFYKNKLPTNKIFIIIKDGENFCYREASFDEFDYTQNPKIAIDKNYLNNFKHLIWDEEIILQINATNVVYNRICNRNDNVEKQAIDDLLNQNLKQCYYCGIDMKTINELNNASKLNSSLPWHHSEGLTKRTTRINDRKRLNLSIGLLISITKHYSESNFASITTNKPTHCIRQNRKLTAKGHYLSV